MASTVTLTEFIVNLKGKFTCYYCRGYLNNPKTLPCLHSYCSGCLRRLEMENLGGETTRCPLCKAPIELPDGVNIENLPSPTYLSRLQEMLRVRNNNPELACGSCDRKSAAISYCSDCKCFVCVSCVEVHERIKVMKLHRITELKDFSAKDLSSLIQAPLSCTQEGHKMEALDQFCKDCEKQVCDKCSASSHRGHNVVMISQASRESKKRICHAMDYLQDKMSSCREDIRRVDQSYKTVERRVITARQEVQRKIEELIGFLRKHCDSTLTELDGIYRDQQVSIIKHRKELELQLSQMQRAHEYAKDVLDRDIGGEILDMERPVKRRFQQLITMKTNTSSQSQRSINVDYIPDRNVLRTLKESELGRIFVTHTDPANCTAEAGRMTQQLTCTGERIEFTIYTKDSDCKPSYSENDRVTVRIQSKQGTAIPTRIEDKKDGSYVVSYTPLKTGVYQIDARVRGEPIKANPFAVHVTTRAEYLKASRINLKNAARPQEYKPLISFGHTFDSQQLKRPCGIAASPSGEVVVADSWNRRILVFNRHAKFVTQLEGSYDMTNPVGVDFDSEGNIVASDSDNQMVNVIDRSGVTLKTFGSEVLDCPWGVCVTTEGKIAVCDWGSASIKEFSQQGKLIKEFSSSISAKPYYIIHHNGKYFVTFDTHCVEVFKNDGGFLYRVGEKGSGEGQLRDPRGMAIDGQENLVVCDSGNHRLHVFTTDGKAFTIGSRGRELGQFDKPQDAVVTSDGRLFVTDYSNNRVQIFKNN